MELSEFPKPTGEAAHQTVLNFFTEIVRSGAQVRTAVDLDQTVVPYHKDPRACKIDPTCHDALLRISQHGSPIIITGRDGWRAQQLVDIPNAVIIGTYGFEARVGNQSYIYEKLAPYADTLTMGFSRFRELFLQNMGITLDREIEREFEIPIPEGGSIVVERKAVDGIFLDETGKPLPQQLTEGLAHVYNCNSVDPKARIRIKTAMEKAYGDIIHDMLQKGVPEQLFYLSPQRHSPDQPGDWGADIGPQFGNSKAHVLLQLLREPSDPKRERYLSRVPGFARAILYVGDSNPDAPGFQAGRLAERFTKGKRQAMGVWVMPKNPDSQDRAKRQCTVAVNGIAENGQMLTKIADLLNTASS